MDNYINKIHEIIEKVNPQLYVDVRYSQQIELYKFSLVSILIGIGLLAIAWWASEFTKIDVDWIVRTGGFVICCAVLMLLSTMSVHKSEVRDTLESTSKSAISDYVVKLSNDDYINVEKQVRAYGHQVSLDSEIERAVNNYLLEILDK